MVFWTFFGCIFVWYTLWWYNNDWAFYCASNVITRPDMVFQYGCFVYKLLLYGVSEIKQSMIIWLKTLEFIDVSHYMNLQPIFTCLLSQLSQYSMDYQMFSSFNCKRQKRVTLSTQTQLMKEQLDCKHRAAMIYTIIWKKTVRHVQEMLVKLCFIV